MLSTGDGATSATFLVSHFGKTHKSKMTLKGHARQWENFDVAILILGSIAIPILWSIAIPILQIRKKAHAHSDELSIFFSTTISNYTENISYMRYFVLLYMFNTIPFHMSFSLDMWQQKTVLAAGRPLWPSPGMWPAWSMALWPPPWWSLTVPNGKPRRGSKWWDAMPGRSRLCHDKWMHVEYISYVSVCIHI